MTLVGRASSARGRSPRTASRPRQYRLNTLRWSIRSGCGHHAVLMRSRSAQPLLHHDQAEEQLVVVLAPRTVSLEESAHRNGLQQLVHERLVIREQLGELASRGRA